MKSRGLCNSHAVADRVGTLPIEMLGANESPLRDVACGNIDRANRRGDGFAVFDARSARGVNFTLRFVQSRDVGAKRRGLMRPVESFDAQQVEGRIHAAEIY